MKLVGVMCVKDEADLLLEVYPHVKGLVDELFVYDDGSVDGTWDIVKNASYAIRKDQDKNRLSINRPHYHHLLEKIKKEFGTKDVWAVITMGDRFFLNKTPKQIIEGAGDYTAVEGVQLDFLRHRLDPWTEENDTYPNWNHSLRQTCRWFRFDERCVVAFKVTDEVTYLGSKYPWPKHVGALQYSHIPMKDTISIDMPFLEHQGRRSPNAFKWRYEYSSRPLSKKIEKPDFSSYEAVKETWRVFLNDYRMYPWIDNNSLLPMIKWHNHFIDEPESRKFIKWLFRGLEVSQQLYRAPPRSDI